jgi:hypothetical protein
MSPCSIGSLPAALNGQQTWIPPSGIDVDQRRASMKGVWFVR